MCGCADELQGISVEELSVEQFRRRCVEPMGEESDEVHIVALADVLQVGSGAGFRVDIGSECLVQQGFVSMAGIVY